MPGTLNEPISTQFSLTLQNYNAESVVEQLNIEPEQCLDYLNNDNITWIHLQGDATPTTLSKIGDALGIHSLHLEDIINTGQRPKLDIIDSQAFVILSLPILIDTQVTVEQVCLFLGERTIISVCSGHTNPFLLVRDRLHKTSGKLRIRKSDYLFYTLIDAIIDHGFPILEVYAERIENIEEVLLERPNESTLQEVHRLRRELLLLRRRLWPHREVVNELLRDADNVDISEETQIYLRDCYDHAISIIELLETYREMTAGMLEVYLSSVSHRLNEVMRVLTVISTLFIPPTFIVGIYGMNFDRNAGKFNMPELSWPYGYAFVWLIIISMTSAMLVYFRKKRWF
jgi:magnesium transporter